MSDNGKHDSASMTPADRKAEALRLRAEHRSLRDIAKTLGVSVTQVRRDVADHEVGGTRDGTPDGTGTVQGEAQPAETADATPSTPFRESKAESKAAKVESKASGVPIRERMASDFEGLYDEIREELGKATKLTKKIWLSCRHCNKRTLVDVPDVKSLLDTLTFLSDRGLGRPGVQEGEAAGTVWSFENRIVVVGDPEEAVDWEDQSVGRRSPVVAEDGEQPAA